MATSEPAPLFPAKPLVPPPNIELMATCGTVTVSKGSTEGGPVGKVTFEVIPESAVKLSELLGKESFELTFSQNGLGDGYSIAGLRLRPDANGSPRAFVTFVAPETVTPAMSLLIAHRLIGTKAKLILERRQTTMNDQLTRKADEAVDTGAKDPCPFPGCTENALHPGKHKVPADYAPPAAAVN
jgi:hypothetical protein